MSIPAIPTDIKIVDKEGRLHRTWEAFFQSVHLFARPLGSNGTTTNRPVSSSAVPIYVGQTYFDTTLGKPIWVKSTGPTVWVDATGATV